ncbi:Macrolide-specific efflux protein macA precursor [Chlamydia abortus]|uniref:Efflux RND transporter periplasmic adaptor subunit n=1 Tax=Paenibacillus residui TaxID=629724 RepID=A0ABW3D8K2_9BACL|nr:MULTISPECIES: efflux RND transporter periplasmic adaptor subunit [Paenibacillaceae]SHE11863.1 Macrolide-specific efflux protein macA precursor [Chlamydia abortus]
MFSKWWMASSFSPNKSKWRILAISLLCLSVILFSGCSLLPKEEEEEELPVINPPKLSTKPEYEVKTGSLQKTVKGSGKLMSLKEEELFFSEENKRIKEIYVQTGDYVEAGQLIAELDVSDLESQLRQKRLQHKKEELALIEVLRDSGDKTSDQIEQAKLDFQIKKEEMAELEESISKSKLYAPFSGSIVGVYMKKGDSPKAFDTVAVLADLSTLTVAATLNADDLKNVAIGMEAIVDINAAGQHKGKILQLPSPKADPNNNQSGRWGGNENQKDTIDNYMLVQLDQMPENVSRGTRLSVTVIYERIEDAILIPPSALRSVGGRNYVQVVDENGNKREVDVEVGLQNSTEVQILKGLTPGQKVVGK